MQLTLTQRHQQHHHSHQVLPATGWPRCTGGAAAPQLHRTLCAHDARLLLDGRSCTTIQPYAIFIFVASGSKLDPECPCCFWAHALATVAMGPRKTHLYLARRRTQITYQALNKTNMAVLWRLRVVVVWVVCFCRVGFGPSRKSSRERGTSRCNAAARDRGTRAMPQGFFGWGLQHVCTNLALLVITLCGSIGRLLACSTSGSRRSRRQLATTR